MDILRGKNGRVELPCLRGIVGSTKSKGDTGVSGVKGDGQVEQSTLAGVTTLIKIVEHN